MKIKKKMETKNKTMLQEIKEQIEQKMTRAIVAAIEDGAKIENLSDGGLLIDGVYLTPTFGTKYHGIALHVNAPEIEQLFKPRKEELEKRAEELRAELKGIEDELKSE